MALESFPFDLKETDAGSRVCVGLEVELNLGSKSSVKVLLEYQNVEGVNFFRVTNRKTFTKCRLLTTISLIAINRQVNHGKSHKSEVH